MKETLISEIKEVLFVPNFDNKKYDCYAIKKERCFDITVFNDSDVYVF